MRSSFRLGVILVVLLVTAVLAAARIQAWNPATHVFIAKQVYPSVADVTNLAYGAVAPDVAIYVTAPQKWPYAFWDTHWLLTDLRLWAWTPAQRAFVRGWNSHNEFSGADHYAHGVPRLVNGTIKYEGGYVTQKTQFLIHHFGLQLPPDLVHMLVETAVDLLVKNDHDGANSWVAPTLYNAVVSRSEQDLDLLNRALTGWPFRRTDTDTLASSEAAFRYISVGYAAALALPPGLTPGHDVDALADFGIWLAHQSYPNLALDKAQVIALLNLAVSVCSADYQVGITEAVHRIPRW